MISHQDSYTYQALAHIRYLSEDIGGRGSCTEKEKQAAIYVAEEMKKMGVESIETEQFKAIASTYRPFGLGFAAALLGSIAALLAPFWGGVGSRVAITLAACLNLMGVWAMLAETEFLNHWARWLLPKSISQNVIGTIPPNRSLRAKVVLCAHLDSHRTPVFYSSERWYAVFSLLLALTFFSMLVGTLAFGLGSLLGWLGTRWVGLVTIPIQAFALGMCLHADLTPYSPGANDDASGVGVTLGLTQRLQTERLEHTEVHLAFTGCEEVGSYGIQAFLDGHANLLGDQAVYIILDEVGLGKLKYLTADGLVLKHKTHPRALELIKTAASIKPEIPLVERLGVAYTDALSATKRGLVAITLCTEADPKTGVVSHWHQMADTIETLQPQTLQEAHDFVWEILQNIDRMASAQ
jgi:hypothetical protein